MRLRLPQQAAVWARALLLGRQLDCASLPPANPSQGAEPEQPVTGAMGAAAGVHGDAADMVSVYLRQKAAEKAGGAHVPELEEGPGSEKRQV